MSIFESIADFQQIFLPLLLFASSLLQLFIAVEYTAGRRVGRALYNGALFLAELFCCAAVMGVTGVGGAAFFGLPACLIWLLAGVLLIYAAVSYIRTLRRSKHDLSRESIKEGCDNLRDGICFFDESGAVQMINHKMLSVEIMLFGKEIQTLDELHSALRHPQSGVDRLDEAIPMYGFPDGTVCRFSERTFFDQDGETVTEVTAADVTELYRKQRELNRENARLLDANRRMRKIMDNMNEIVREEEILTMKMRVHDDIGHSILSARKALLQQNDIAVIRESAALWEKAVSLLDRANHMPQPPDEWESIQNRAGDLGMKIEIDGELPKQERLRHLLALAVRECMTNCVRHADGSKVFVEVVSCDTKITCVITNDGRRPSQAIVEGGGLSGLRRRIESEGGRMELQRSPRFALTIVLPRKEEIAL